MSAITPKKARRMTFALIFVIFFGIFALGFIKNLVGYNILYSEGDRAGQIVKLSQKGLVWKTWEGSMGITQSGAYVDYWDFSIDLGDARGKQTLEYIQKAFTSGAIIRLHYQQYYGALPWHGATSYFVTAPLPAL